MKPLTRSPLFIFAQTWAAASLLFGVVTPPVQAAEPQAYSGRADLCAVDQSKVVVENVGSGQTIMRNMVQLFRISSDDAALMNGWEVLTFDSKQMKNGKQYSEGETYFIPNNINAGAFAEEFNFLVTANISGMYQGIGSLKGVTADYVLAVNADDPEYCYDHPYCDDPGTDCTYLTDIPGQDPFGFHVTGTIYDMPE